jgi:hypothetical protein
LSGAHVASAATSKDALDSFLTELATSFKADPARFQKMVGRPTIFDDVDATGEKRQFGTPKILRFNARTGRAIVLLSASVETENSGDRTYYSSLWSGAYPATWNGSAWSLGERVPFGVNRIASHDLKVAVNPLSGLSVSDRIAIEVTSSAGFFTMLNSSARIKTVTVDGKPAPFEFQNGLLRVDTSRGGHNLVLAYEIIVERPEKGGNSAAFAKHAGHVRNQYFWHPFFSFGETRSMADFSITATIPADYQLALDIPQSETVAGNVRTVRARSATPTVALTLAYDDKWQPTVLQAGGIKLTLFTSKDFTPSVEAVTKAFEDSVSILKARYGSPPLDELKIVQGMQRPGNGWHFFSNQAIFTGPAGGPPMRIGPFPNRDFLGHEIAHLWTRPSGSTRNFLAEGWATFAEDMLIAPKWGAEAVRQFWRDQARLLTTNPTSMATSIDQDARNSGVSYAKGAWVLRMLERLTTPSVFDGAIRRYASNPLGKTSYEDFLESFGDKSSMVRRFAQPWISEKGLPSLSVTSTGNDLLISQSGPHYWLPNMIIRLIRQDGTSVFVKADIEGATTRVDLRGARVAAAELDPFEDYLLEKRLFATSSP